MRTLTWYSAVWEMTRLDSFYRTFWNSLKFVRNLLVGKEEDDITTCIGYKTSKAVRFEGTAGVISQTSIHNMLIESLNANVKER